MAILYASTVLWVHSMQVRLVKMREKGIEIDRRRLRELYGCIGHLVVMDVTDQGLRRSVKVARLMQGEQLRFEIKDVHLVWVNEDRMTLSGFEQVRNEDGQLVDYAQSWLCVLAA